MRLPLAERPAARALVTGSGPPAEEIAGRIYAEHPLDRFGMRVGANHHEHRRRVDPLDAPVAAVAQADGLELLAAVRLDDLGLSHHLDVGRVLDPVDQIAGHRHREPFTTHYDA